MLHFQLKKSCLKYFSCLLKLEVLILIADCEKLLMFRQTEALSLATADRKTPLHLLSKISNPRHGGCPGPGPVVLSYLFPPISTPSSNKWTRQRTNNVDNVEPRPYKTIMSHSGLKFKFMAETHFLSGCINISLAVVLADLFIFMNFITVTLHTQWLNWGRTPGLHTKNPKS